MKKVVMAILLAFMVMVSAFAEAHKNQKVVVIMTNPANLTKISSGSLKEPKLQHGNIPDGWHVVSMYVQVVSPGQTDIYFVLEEN